MLDLADAVVERVHGPVLFLCLARPELLEQRPDLGCRQAPGAHATLPPLSPEDAATRSASCCSAGRPRRPWSTGSARRRRAIRCIWSSSRRCWPIRGCWSTAVAGLGRCRGRDPGIACRRFSPPGSTASTPGRACSWNEHRSRAAGSGCGTPPASLPELTRDEVEAGDLVARPERSHPARGRGHRALALRARAGRRGHLPGPLEGDGGPELHEELADWLELRDAGQPDVDEAGRAPPRARAAPPRGARPPRRALRRARARAGELFAAAGLARSPRLDFITTRDLLGRAAVLLPSR